MLLPQSDNTPLAPDDLTALGPAVVHEVHDAVEAVVASPHGAEVRLYEAIGVLVERTRAFNWPPEKSATVLTRIFRDVSMTRPADPAPTSDPDPDRAVAVYQLALVMCMEAHRRDQPYL